MVYVLWWLRWCMCQKIELNLHQKKRCVATRLSADDRAESLRKFALSVSTNF